MNKLIGSAVTVKELSKSFYDSSGNQLQVIDEFSFFLERGLTVALLGASGCGKTTLLSMIAGKDKDYSGKINTDIKRPGPELGFMRQGERLLPWLTAVDNVKLGARLTGKNDLNTEDASALLKQAGLEDFDRAFPAQLSGGMSQRVLLARTLATSPELLLLDEPFGQVDVLSRRELCSVVRNYVNQTSSACLLVTHSVEEAVMMADRILILSRRPSRIVKRFCIDSDHTDPAFERVERRQCLDQIYSALLEALSSSSGDSK